MVSFKRLMSPRKLYATFCAYGLHPPPPRKLHVVLKRLVMSPFAFSIPLTCTEQSHQ